MREGRFASNTAVTTLLAGVARGMEAVHAHTNPSPNRDPNPTRRLGLADLQAFVACEAQAVGLRCTVLETVAYALTFCLFELVRDDGGGGGPGVARGR